ncbi:MAG TPA: methyltransferase domain-containing protein [Anaerovoracaceae bacterium]|nr:methyltransferase domain-containing protein [Anaerovoracaceae bacterium]
MKKTTSKKEETVFDIIAPIYGRFFDYQIKHYNAVLENIKKEFDFSGYQSIIDVGCGTGALCSVLNQKGMIVTGIDSSQKMLRIAEEKQKGTGIRFMNASVLERLPFEDKSFDISIAAHVAHGLKESDRAKMYAEMSRVVKHLVIFYDYNQNRSVLTNIVEWLERGDYFNFIRKVRKELKENFLEVKIIDTEIRASLYVCKPQS